jgi:Na+/phosphate symporter
MNIRLRKLIGTLAFVTGTVAYFLFAISVAIARLPGTPLYAHLVFYLAATLIWLFFAGLLIRWMQAPRRTDKSEGARSGA